MSYNRYTVLNKFSHLLDLDLFSSFTVITSQNKFNVWLINLSIHKINKINTAY